MKATKAYIASLGTTGVLLGASLLMLAVVSAVVAFDRWPSGQVSTRVQTLVLSERAPAIRVSTHPGLSDRALRRSAVASALQRAARLHAPLANVHGVGGVQRVAGERQVGGHPASPIGPLPKTPIDTPPFDLPPIDVDPTNTSSLAAAAADQTQNATGTAGGAIGGDGGQAVSSTGSNTANAVRALPLPGPVFPG